MVKTIDLDVLELALWNAYTNYAQAPNKRAMRVPITEDTAACANALKAIRNSWSLVHSGEEPGATFPNIKARVLNGLRVQEQWSEATRNLYSSALSAYMSWDRKKLTIRPDTRAQLQIVRAVGQAITRELDANR